MQTFVVRILCLIIAKLVSYLEKRSSMPITYSNLSTWSHLCRLIPKKLARSFVGAKRLRALLHIFRDPVATVQRSVTEGTYALILDYRTHSTGANHEEIRLRWRARRMAPLGAQFALRNGCCQQLRDENDP